MVTPDSPYLQEDGLAVWCTLLTQPWSEHLLQDCRFQVLIAMCVCYLCYYLIYVVHKPRLVTSNSKLGQNLKEELSVLEEYYWPTIWGFQAHLQTICRVIFKSKPFVPYEREELHLSDGGVCSLHWVLNNDNNLIYPEPDTRPTFLLLPGLTGQSHASYCLHLVTQATELGYRSVVQHNRGFDAPLKTPRTFSATNTEDVRDVINTIKKRYPGSPIFAVGVSLGGMILTHYLSAVKDEEQPVIAAFVVSAPWNCFISTESLESPLNWLLFNRHLTWNLRRLVRRNYAMFKQNERQLSCKVDEVLRVTTIRQYDNTLICPMFGYKDWEEYYRATNLDSCDLESIAVPTLFLNSEDDPFSPGPSIPVDRIKKCDSLGLVLTKYGGHIAFIDGFFIHDNSIVEKLFRQFATSRVKEYIDKQQQGLTPCTGGIMCIRMQPQTDAD